MSYPMNPQPPMFDAQEYQRRQDDDNLRLLSLFHYILGGLTIFGSCFFLIYFFLGLVAMSSPQSLQSGSSHSTNSAEGDKVLGWMFTLIGSIATLSGWTIGGLTAYAGKCLSQRRSSTFITVMSVINCLNVPVGTALGVFTIVVLSRPTVKALFDGRPIYASAGGPQMGSGSPQQPWYKG